jgi:hypothetical protein
MRGCSSCRRNAAIKRWDSAFMDARTAGMLGDKRYSYVPFHDLASTDQSLARRMYPHKAVGAKYNFIDEHYYYPVGKDRRLPTGRGGSRVLAIPYKKIVDEAYMASLGYEVNPAWKGGSEREAAKWKGPLPKGWDKGSRDKFWDSLVGDVKHKVTKCMEQMKGKVDDEGAFCASLADRADPGWRSRASSGMSILAELRERKATVVPFTKPTAIMTLMANQARMEVRDSYRDDVSEFVRMDLLAAGNKLGMAVAGTLAGGGAFDMLIEWGAPKARFKKVD